MGIKFLCPNGHKMNVKSFLAGKKGICPKCGTKVDIPLTGDDGQADGADVSLPVAAAASAKTNAPTFGMVVPNQPAAAKAGGQPLPMPTPGWGQPGSDMPAAMPAAQSMMPGSQPMPMPGYPAAGAYPAQPGMHMPGMATAAPMNNPVAAAVVPAHLQPVAAAPAAPAEPAAPRDAIAEAPQASWHVRPPSGGQFGPAKGDMMREWISQGRVTADSLVWREGWNDWQKADVVFPSLRPAGAPASGEAARDKEKAEPEALVRAPSSGTFRMLPRRKNKDAVMLFSVLLFIVVAILALVFGYVLMKNNQRRNQPTTTEVIPVLFRQCSPHAPREEFFTRSVKTTLNIPTTEFTAVTMS